MEGGLILDRSSVTTNRLAASYMLASVVGLSLIPLIVASGKGAQSPFLFNAFWRVGLCAGCFVFLFVLYRDLIINRSVLACIRHHLFRWTMLFLIMNNFQMALLSISSGFVNISISAVLFETWPIFLVILMGWLFAKDGRYERNIFALIPVLFLAFVGVVLVSMSQVDNLEGLADLFLPSTVMGVMVGLGAAVMSGFAAFGVKWGVDLASELRFGSLDAGHDMQSLNLFAVVVANFISSLFSVPLSFALGAFNGEVVGIEWQIVVAALIGGSMVHAVSDTFWRKANLLTSNLGVNALGYLIPLASLAFLWLFSYVDVFHTQYLVLGALAIISANMFVNLKD